ncbi:MAG: TonB-dependent receptor [Gemmatimonadota bacterium]
MRLLLALGLASATFSLSLHAQGTAISGRVFDAASSASLADATVTIEGSTRIVATDAEGRYRLDGVPAGPQVLRAVRIGYAPVRKSLVVPAAGSLTVDLPMARSALDLPNVTVTADPVSRAKGELGTASVIEREAIKNQTATSLLGLLELVPGVVLQPPGLDGVQQFGLRGVPLATGALGAGAGQPTSGDLASFGTQIVLDGVPISNNANLQSLGPRGEFSFSTSAGGGIDLRRIPASTIERVEVIRGVPSARFGDLTQGAVLVDTRAGRIDPELLVRLDARTLEGSVVGGTGLGRLQTGSGSFDIARTRLAPGQTDDQSYRFAVQGAHRYEAKSLRLDTRFDAYQLVEDRPESPLFPGIESHSRDNGIRASERARLELGRARLEWTGSFELTRQRTTSRDNKLRPAQPFTDRLTEGTQVGKFIGGVYNSKLELQGDPRALYSRLELVAQPRLIGHDETFRAGLELRREWNAGPGYLFDIEFPPQSTFNGVNGFDRPRRFDLIPPLVTTGLYADERASWPLGREGNFSVQGGLRVDLLHDGRTWLSGVRDRMVEPRINVELAPTRWIRFRAGAGRLAKLPSLASLYPGLQYYDLVNVNYYANNPAERLAVLTTRIIDRTNPNLGYSRADKLEAGFEAELAPGAQIAFTAFHDRVNGAVGIVDQTTSFFRELFRIVDSTTGKGRPPDFETPAYATETVPVLIDRPSNNLTATSSGAELVATIPEIPGTRTRAAIQASYVKERLDNAGIELARDFSDFQQSDHTPRSPYYVGSRLTGDRLLLTTRLIHQQPQAGLLVTGTIQVTLRETRQDLGSTDTLGFAGYITRAGEVVPVLASDRGLPQYHDLRAPRGGFLTDPQRGAVDWLFSLQVAKTLPGGGRLSFYAFNAFDRLGNFGDRQTTPRLFPANRFGVEVTMPMMVRK